MANIFDGSFEEFKGRLRAIGFNTYWKEYPNGVWQLKAKCGCILSWSDTQRTYWSQGKAEAKERMDKLLAACLEDDPKVYRLVVVGTADKVPYDQLVAMLNKAGLDVFPTQGA